MTIWLWAGFIVFVMVVLALDLGVFNRKAHVISSSTALKWVTVFVLMGVLFNVLLYFGVDNNWLGMRDDFVREIVAAETRNLPAEQAAMWQPEPGSAPALALEKPAATAAIQFLQGWLMEYSLSVDNLFVIALIFGHFRVPAIYQHRVLFWGILGALVMRGLMIGVGIGLVHYFEWMIYVFGAFLIYTAIKMVQGHEEEPDFERNWLIRTARRLFPVTATYEGQHFFSRLPDGRRAVTPLFLVLLIVEMTDVVFAVDSIPVIIGITRDPFIVFTSNVFAIMGLRSLYFALAGLMGRFEYLKYSLAFILAFVGVKMLLEMPWIQKNLFEVHVNPFVSLGVIVAALAAGVIVSLLRPPSPAAQEAQAAAEEATHVPPTAEPPPPADTQRPGNT